LNKRDNQRAEAAKTKFLRTLAGFAKLGHERNVYIRGKLKLQNIVEDIGKYQENWKQTGIRKTA
jgi:hypothetical protein